VPLWLVVDACREVEQGWHAGPQGAGGSGRKRRWSLSARSNPGFCSHDRNRAYTNSSNDTQPHAEAMVALDATTLAVQSSRAVRLKLALVQR